MNHRLTIALPILAIFSAFAAACSTNVTVPGNGSSPASEADCTSRCESKAEGCGAPSGQASQACGGICDGTYTNDQLSCLESKSCSELQTSDLSSVCPRSSSNSSSSGSVSGGGGSGGGSGTSSGGSSSNDHFSCDLNGECFKCQDSDGVSKCSITTGPGPGCVSTDSSYCN